MDPSQQTVSDETAAERNTRFGKYLLVERVAVGGMAEVWLAKRVEASGEVSELLALKRILPKLSSDGEFIKMFVDEARIAGRLRHPGIVPMHELGRIGSTYYIAMEYVWGRDLLQILRTAKARKVRLPLPVVLAIGSRLLRALEHAHTMRDKQGQPLSIVHRDISPQNVLLGFGGQVKLIDFGIAKATSRTTTTQAGTLKGKVGYMSPEQARGLAIDARSDLFAMGTLLYEMLTIRPLFARGNNVEAMNRVRDADVPPLASRVPDVPPALAAIVERALRREPADRFDSALDMALALESLPAATPLDDAELSAWMQDLFGDEVLAERERLDALDAIGRTPIPEKSAQVERGLAGLFDTAEDEETTAVAGHTPYVRDEHAEPANEVFFHHDELIAQVGESNPEGHAKRPLKAVFRPGRVSVAEAYRAPLVEREDRPEREGPSRVSIVPPGARPSSAPSIPPSSARSSSSRPIARASAPPEEPTRSTLPHHSTAGSVPAPRPSVPPIVVRGPTLLKQAIDEDDDTFDDGGIREPLVPSRAGIVAVIDEPPLPEPSAPRTPVLRDAPIDVPTRVAPRARASLPPPAAFDPFEIGQDVAPVRSRPDVAVPVDVDIDLPGLPEAPQGFPVAPQGLPEAPQGFPVAAQGFPATPPAFAAAPALAPAPVALVSAAPVSAGPLAPRARGADKLFFALAGLVVLGALTVAVAVALWLGPSVLASLGVP